MITAFPSGRPVRALDLTLENRPDNRAPQNQDERPDFGAMPPDELVAAINQLEYDKSVISAQIDDDQAGANYRGLAWRKAAGFALSVRIARLHQAYAELDRRQPKPTKPDPDLAKLEAKARLKTEGAALHEAQRAYAIAKVQEHQAAQARLETEQRVKRNAAFVAAAEKKLSPKVLAAIWAAVDPT